MVRLIFPLHLGLAASFALSGVYAQQQQPASTRYSASLYLNVAPEKEAAFIAWYKSGPGAKVTRALLDGDPNILSFSLRRVAYGGNPAPRANFVAVTGRNGPPPEIDTAKRDATIKQATGMAYADYIAKLREMSTVVGSTLAHMHEMTPGFQISEGDYVVSRRIKTATGRGTQGDIAEINKRRLAMQSERVKSGAIKGWAYGHLTFPAGQSLPWTTTISTVHKDLASAVGGGGGGGGGGAAGAAAFAKLFPNVNYVAHVDSIREMETQVRVDLYRVVMAARR